MLNFDVYVPTCWRTRKKEGNPRLTSSQKVTGHAIPAEAGIDNDMKMLDSAKASLRAPVLAGMTSMGQTRLFTKSSGLRHTGMGRA